MKKVCCYCLDRKSKLYKYLHKNIYRKIFKVTDGICEECYKKVMEEFKKENQKKGR